MINSIEIYKLLHKYCPNCGSENYISTLAAFQFDAEIGIKDNNKVHCKCGFKHIVHDRVKTKVVS